MMFALDSNLSRARPGEGEPPYYCQSCARELQIGKTGSTKVFLHPEPSCESEPPTIETTRFREKMRTSLGEEFVDVEVGDRIAPGRFPDTDVILEPRCARVTTPDVADIIERWNGVGVAPLFVWCAPQYGHFRKKADELHLLASVPEATIIERLTRADFPYLLWEENQLFGMRIYSAKERFYFGTVEPIELNKVKPMVFETVYGLIAGLDAVEATQSKL